MNPSLLPTELIQQVSQELFLTIYEFHDRKYIPIS